MRVFKSPHKAMRVAIACVLACGMAAGGLLWLAYWASMVGSWPVASVAAWVARSGWRTPVLPPHNTSRAENAVSVHAPVGVLPAVILMYHHVGELPVGADALRRDLTVSTTDFARQVAWFRARGYVSVTLEELYRATQREFSLPAKTVVFTFDDGYADVFENAIPILRQNGMSGSFAVVPGFLGQPDYATWEAVAHAKAQGMEIVSHTQNHFDGSNPKFDAAFIKQNLQQSVQELESHVGPIPKILVYPYGHYTLEYIQVAREVGFTMALTTHFGRYVDPSNLMLTPRVRVHGAETMEKFEESITGIKPAVLSPEVK